MSFKYSDLDPPHQAAGIHSNKQSSDLDINRDVRLRDAIAIALTTENPGDVFAVLHMPAYSARSSKERASYTRGRIRYKRTHSSYREYHYRSRDGPLSLPDLSVRGIRLSEMKSSATPSCWYCRHMYLRLIFKPSFPAWTRFLGIVGTQCLHLPLSGEILLK